MARIAEEILTRLEKSRSSRVVNFSAHLSAKIRSEENLNEIHRVHTHLLRGHDPLHGAYVMTHSLVSMISEELSRISSLKPYVEIVSPANSKYNPDGPPFSSLTRSYFSTWAFFDLKFGPDQERLAECILFLAKDLEIPGQIYELIYRMLHSRMGVYEQCGVSGSLVLLRDVADDKIYNCYIPSLELGEKGQLWYVRRLPPFLDWNYSVIFTTPYLLTSSKEVWHSFFNRALQKMTTNKPRSLSDAIHDLQKTGLNTHYWNDYIFSSYSDSRENAIFLKGVPDQLDV